MSGSFTKGSQRVWNLETLLLGLLGFACFYIGIYSKPELNVIEETIVLVVFLGGLMGIAPMPYPDLKGKKFWYPIVSGLTSAIMDSFLVLLMVGRLPLKGNQNEKYKFLALNMMAALIGGLLIYFGEVYALPHYLKYGKHGITDGLPLFPPVMIFLLILGWQASKLKLEVGRGEVELEGGDHAVMISASDQPKRWKIQRWNLVEFSLGITLLLVTHNPVLCLGILLLWSFLTGQGMDLINVMMLETEINVMLLLLVCWVAYEPIKPYVSGFEGFYTIIPSGVNAVFAGALVPASGDFWMEITGISAGSLITPISSLVGIMLFKDLRSWGHYMKLSIPHVILWIVLSLGWFKFIWPYIFG